MRLGLRLGWFVALGLDGGPSCREIQPQGQTRSSRVVPCRQKEEKIKILERQTADSAAVDDLFLSFLEGCRQ